VTEWKRKKARQVDTHARTHARTLIVSQWAVGQRSVLQSSKRTINQSSLTTAPWDTIHRRLRLLILHSIIASSQRESCRQPATSTAERSSTRCGN